jgi:flagellar basal body-associated protein FliL
LSKNVKIIIILSITALVIGMLIYFYKKNKVAKPAAKPVTPVTPVAPAEKPTVKLSTETMGVVSRADRLKNL